MPAAHILCRPITIHDDPNAGCFVVCDEHGLRLAFGSAYAVAKSACIEHNAVHHADRSAQPDQLVSVIYESRAAQRFGADELHDLLTEARLHNRESGVTGMLLSERGLFLQALEGPAPVVDRLLEKIRQDPRHDRLRVLAREVRQQRRFPDWAMAHGHIGQIEARPLEEYYEGLLIARGETLDAPRRRRRSTTGLTAV